MKLQEYKTKSNNNENNNNYYSELIQDLESDLEISEDLLNFEEELNNNLTEKLQQFNNMADYIDNIAQEIENGFENNSDDNSVLNEIKIAYYGEISYDQYY